MILFVKASVRNFSLLFKVKVGSVANFSKFKYVDMEDIYNLVIFVNFCVIFAMSIEFCLMC